MYNLHTTYDDKFFVANLEDSKPVADYLAPVVIEQLNVKTVLDYGCATGHWLSAFMRHGADALGIEGSESIKQHLVCPIEKILNLDLRFPLYAAQIALPDNIDLAFSFEVAEHIEETYANVFIDNLVLKNPNYVMLTAAPPGQGGLGHVNEQPKSYWYEKFASVGYEQDVENENFFTEKIEKGRRLPDAPPELQRPDQHIVCPRHPETRGCENGVWIPPWLPKNLMVVRKTQ